MNSIPFIADSDPGRTRAKVAEYADQGHDAPLCPWCRHWQPIGWAWTCNNGRSAGERVTECDRFWHRDQREQMSLMGHNE